MFNQTEMAHKPIALNRPRRVAMARRLRWHERESINVGPGGRIAAVADAAVSILQIHL
jgi:hypothetical protein